MEKLTQAQIQCCAEITWTAELERREIPMLTLATPGLDREAGYLIQAHRAGLAAEAGHRLTGYKLGSTSLRKRQQMGTATSSYGRLYDYMAVQNGQALELSTLIHPKVEPEVTFVLGRDLCGPYVTAAEVMHATDHVVGSLEVIDSRYIDFKFTGGDVVADNISGARYVLGTKPMKPDKIDLALLGVVVRNNGQDLAYAAACEVLGHPARAVAELANNLCSREGLPLLAGQIIMTGGITQSFTLARGDCITTDIAELGGVCLPVV